MHFYVNNEVHTLIYIKIKISQENRCTKATLCKKFYV